MRVCARANLPRTCFHASMSSSDRNIGTATPPTPFVPRVEEWWALREKRPSQWSLMSFRCARCSRPVGIASPRDTRASYSFTASCCGPSTALQQQSSASRDVTQ